MKRLTSLQKQLCEMYASAGTRVVCVLFIINWHFYLNYNALKNTYKFDYTLLKRISIVFDITGSQVSLLLKN